MIKNLLATFFSFFILNVLNAQDVIIKKNGEEIKAKIEEVNVSEIKYRKFDNPDGPVFYMSKSDVFMIRYQDGTKETLVEIPLTPPQRQTYNEPQPQRKTSGKNSQPQIQVIRNSGPRVGITHIGAGETRKALYDNFKGTPTMSQFGWGFETRLFTTKQGASGTVNFLPLIGGVEQGLFLPSITGLIGVRTNGGIEFGIGPNLSLNGAGMVIMAGTTFKAQGMIIPIHLAAIPSDKGFIFSFLTGFNIPKN